MHIEVMPNNILNKEREKIKNAHYHKTLKITNTVIARNHRNQGGSYSISVQINWSLKAISQSQTKRIYDYMSIGKHEGEETDMGEVVQQF